MFKQLWNDDAGALIAVEWLFLATILIIGLVVGLKAVQQAVVNELEEFASAVGSLSQSYSFGGTSGCCASTSGSLFTDEFAERYLVDACTTAGSPPIVACD